MQKQSDLIFLGDSLTAFHDWSGFGTHHNAGIAGDTTDGLLFRLHYTLAKKPETVVLMIGINDLLQGQALEKMKVNYIKIFERLEAISSVLILSLLPVSANAQTTMINEKVILVNHFLKQESNARGFRYIDLYTPMSESNGGLKKELSSDGVHLTAKGYTVWENAIKAHFGTI